MAEVDTTTDDDKALDWNNAKDAARQTETGKTATVDDAISGEEGIAQLKAQLAKRDADVKASRETAEAERKARVEAERRAAEQGQQAQRYRTEAVSREADVLNSAMEALTHERANAKAELKSAWEAGEFEKAAEAQDKLASINARYVNYESAKAAMEQNGARPATTEGRVEQPARTEAAADPTENFLTVFTPASQAWLRQHREHVQISNGQPRLSPKLLAVHHLSEAEGIAPDTPEYFAFLEEQTQPRRTEQQTTDDDTGNDPPELQPVQTAPAPRRAAQVAAPVSRDAPNSGPARPTTRIRLSAEEVEAARISGISELDYYNNKQALRAEGKIGRVTH